MSPDTPKSQRDNVLAAPDAQVLEQIYSVPLERPLGRELFTVMAALLGHVLHVNNLHQSGTVHE